MHCYSRIIVFPIGEGKLLLWNNVVIFV